MSTPTAIRGTLATLIRSAAKDPRGWLFLEDGEATGNTSGLLLSDVDPTEDLEPVARSLGFPNGGLHAQDLQSIFEWTKGLVQSDPGDAELVRSFWYYFKFDAFLPDIDASDPPRLSRKEAQAKRDREFYDSLGPEREGIVCRSVGCRRGAISLSVFCRPHHFESIERRRCPFDD
jgi:hypothetical protein